MYKKGDQVWIGDIDLRPVLCEITKVNPTTYLIKEVDGDRTWKTPYCFIRRELHEIQEAIRVAKAHKKTLAPGDRIWLIEVKRGKPVMYAGPVIKVKRTRVEFKLEPKIGKHTRYAASLMSIQRSKPYEPTIKLEDQITLELAEHLVDRLVREDDAAREEFWGDVIPEMPEVRYTPDELILPNPPSKELMTEIHYRLCDATDLLTEEEQEVAPGLWLDIYMEAERLGYER